jgi:hypothetical protein
MGLSFDDITRRNIAERWAAFVRLPESDATLPLKRAAVAIALLPLIDQFREVLAGRDTRVDTLEQPVFAWK